MADMHKHVAEDGTALSIHDVEKSGLHEEQLERAHSQESSDPRITCFTPQEQRKIIHRIDRRLVVTLGAMYCISLMDRTNLSAANIAGLVVRDVIREGEC